ncbi:MAG: hypothetical protein DMG35_07925, partial [Acidobacteria bacterium]
MLRKRLLVLLGGCFLMGSAAWADDVGYVDCSSHPEATQVFAKARQTPDIVASVSCGERFTILVYGFIFSRVQTRDGKVGYVYSNLISVDHSGASVPQPVAARVPAAPSPSVTMAAERTSVPRTPAINAQSAPQQTTQPVQPEPAAVPAAVSQPQPAPAQPAPAPVASAATASAPEPTSKAPESAAATVAPSPVPPAAAQPAPILPTAAQVEAATSASATQPASNVPETAAAQPSPAAAAQPQPQPESAEPAAQPVRNANVRSTWEKPVPGAGSRRNFLLELFGGFSYAGLKSGGTMTNFLGGMGSFGYNMTSWLQIVGDSSYNTVTVSGTKNVLYGNHFGPRFFYRRPNRWGITPFAEALVGGSRLDSTIAGYKTSSNCISYKAGGGVDIRASRHFEIRLLNVDYYRTSFGANTTQN